MAELRIVFLVALGLTALLFVLRKPGGVLTLGEIGQIIVDFLLVLALGALVGSFTFLITRRDPMPVIRQAAYQMSLQQLVSFDIAIPQRLDNDLEVESIVRADTDGDGFREWVVFYKFELQNGLSPIKGAVYDSDRGNPPVLFPYSLKPLDRDYLAEGQTPGAVTLDLQPVTEDSNGPEGGNLPEVMVDGSKSLNIFRFQENSEAWDFPRDAPPRYQPIGSFRGSGGVDFDPQSRQVTVFDRDGFERSQLAVRSVYAINPATNSYLDSFDPNKLAAPIVSTVDFYQGPPREILNTAFPEKIVLAFYTAACGNAASETLCNNDVAWDPVSFLAPDSEALAEYRNGNPGYFGLTSLDNMSDISIATIRYYPSLETDPDLLVTGGGRDVVTGEQGQLGVVDLELIANDGPAQALRYVMGLAEGQWKIFRRAAVDDPVIEAPVEIVTPPQ